VKHLAVLATAIGIFFIQAPTFILHPADHVADGGDAVLNAWILAWNAHALANPWLSVWNAPIYNPVPNTLAFSEAMFGNLPITLPVQYLTGNHVLAANALVFCSFVLGMYTTFLLAFRLTANYAAGIVAGIIFSFNPYRWSEIHHLQLLPFFWAPPALLCCHQFLETRNSIPLIGATLLLVAQTYASIYLGIILFLMMLVFAACYWIAESRATDFRAPFTAVQIAAAGIVALVALAPIGLPYLRVIRDWEFSRSESENATFSAEPFSFFVCNSCFQNRLGGESLLPGPVRGAYGLGIVPWLLAGTGLVLAWRVGKDRVCLRFGWTALVMAVFMLGPYLIWLDQKTDIPLPYLLVYHVVPGAKAMRVPARFVFPLLLCLAVLSGYAVLYLTMIWKRWPMSARVVVCLVGVLLLAADYALADRDGFKLQQREQFAPVYDYLAASGNGQPVLELPAEIRQQFSYLHYQTAHWRPLVGGETGCYTPAVLELARRTRGEPTDAALQLLRLTPAKTIVIHLDQYEPQTAMAWRNADLTPYGFELIGPLGNAVVWERIDPIVPLSAHLRVVDVVVTRRPGLWADRWHVIASVTPAEPGLPWRFLDRGKTEMDVVLVGTDGREYRHRKPVAVPPYLLPGETATISIGGLRAGRSEVRSVSISADVIQSTSH
jgi:hypothetical protein